MGTFQWGPHRRFLLVGCIHFFIQELFTEVEGVLSKQGTRSCLQGLHSLVGSEKIPHVTTMRER